MFVNRNIETTALKSGVEWVLKVPEQTPRRCCSPYCRERILLLLNVVPFISSSQSLVKLIFIFSPIMLFSFILAHIFKDALLAVPIIATKIYISLANIIDRELIAEELTPVVFVIVRFS